MIIISGKPMMWCSSLLLVAVSASAQQQHEPPSLEQLLRQPVTARPAEVEVSTASRQQQTAAQAAQITYLVTADEISRLNLRTFSEVLSLFPGLYVSSDSTYGYLTARGIGRPGDYNSRLLFLVDGNRVNDNIYDAGLIGNNFYLDTRLIERVEFIPGTGSALYGNNAYLGVVNIISKKVHQLQGVRLAGHVSDQDQHDWLMSYGLRQADGHEGYFAVSRDQRRRIAIPEADAPDVLRQSDSLNQDQNTKLSGNYSYRRFSLSFAGVQRDRQQPALYQQSIATSQVQNDNAFIAARYGHRLGQDLEWFSHVSANQIHFKTVSPVPADFGLPTGPHNELIFNVEGKWLNLDQRLSYQASATQSWLFGLDLQRDYHQSYRYSINDSLTISAVDSVNSRAGVFAQHEWQLSATHRLFSGVRYDHSAQQVRELSPKLGWVWQPDPVDLWRLNYGRAFRAPNEYELETNRFYQRLSPRSEQTETLELSWQRAWSPGLHSSLTLYRNQITNLITAGFGQTTLVPFFNDSPVNAHGLELVLQQDWLDRSSLKLSLSLQRARYNDQQPLTNAAEQILNLQYYRPLWRDQLALSYRLLAASSRLSHSGRLGGFASHDLSASFEVNPALHLQFTLKNLTGHRHVDAPLPSAVELVQPGRSAELSLQWSWQ